MKICVYNNDTGIADAIELLCLQNDMTLFRVGTERQLFQELREKRPSLVIIDIQMDEKGMGGELELITALRKESRVPLLVLSSEKSETAKIMALNAGADDYITSDCNPLEVFARIKSQLRRYMQLMNCCGALQDSIYRVDDLVIDDNTRKVTVAGREIRLTPLEYKILRLLAKEQGRTLSINQIYENIWQMEAIGADNTVAVHVRHIREKIEHDPAKPRYLKVVWGNGYKVG